MSPDLDTIRRELTVMLPDLRERYGVGRFWVVGSRARGDFREDSDLDLLVEFERRDLSLFDFAGLELEIQDRLGMEIDLAEPEALRPEIRREVEQDAVLI